MSIYPGGKPKSLTRKWQIAAYDLPVPDRLIENEDTQEWRSYLGCLSPAQQLGKFGEAIDQFHALIAITADPMTLPESGQIRLYSKWAAATEAGVALGTRLQFFAAENGRPRGFDSDLEEYIFFAQDFLEGAKSPEAPKWEKRGAAHKAIDEHLDTPFLKFLNHAIATFASSENAKKDPPPLPEPPPGLKEPLPVGKPLKLKHTP